MFHAGDEIDIWVVERPLGAGGMGSVYRCHNRNAKRIVSAVKVLDGLLTRNPQIRNRFIREAELLFALDHPNIVKVRNVRMDVATPYLEMEFVEGRSLERHIDDATIAPVDAVRVCAQIADALAYVHARGVAHRDIKPANIVVQSSGDAKLVDFGIASEADATRISESGTAFGSAGYVPPEWLRPDELDPQKWDLYALGVTLWEALCFRSAFPVNAKANASQAFLATIAAKQTHPPLDPGPEWPQALRDVIGALTEPDADARLGSAAEARDRLASIDIDPERGPGRRTPTPRQPTQTWSQPANAETMVPQVDQPSPGFDRGYVEVRPPAPQEVGPVPASDAPSPARPRPTPAATAVGVAATVAAFAAAALTGAVALALWATTPRDPTSPVPVAPITPADAVAPPAPDVAPPTPDAPPPAPPAPTAVDAPVTIAPPPEAPERPRDTRPTKQPERPRDGAAPTGADGGKPPVQMRELAAFLEDHPEWRPGVAQGFDASYLKGWDSATPPADRASGPAVHVPVALAEAFCASRGGLAAVGAAPLTWTDSRARPSEHRTDDGRPVIRQADGTVVPNPRPSQSSFSVGFRCAR